MVTLAPGLSVNLNLLQTFLLVAEHKSFREAARRGARSYSAVSAQIRQLEEQLAVRLFNRTTRSVELTIYGEMLLETAKTALGDVRSAFETLRTSADRDLTRVSFACSPSLAGNFMPSLLKEFRAVHPQVMIAVTELPAFQLAERIVAGEFAFGIGPARLERRDLEVEFLTDEPFVAVVPEEHPIAKADVVRLSQLSEVPILLPAKMAMTREVIEIAARQQAIQLNVVYESLHYLTLVQLVAAGAGIAIMPRSAASNIARRNFVLVPIADPDLRRHIAYQAMAGRRISPVAEELVHLIKREIGGYISRRAA
jgi:DNA-binding transcriptional LysR family regulator